MKKLFVGLLILIAAILGCLSFFLPSIITNDEKVSFKASPQAVFRVLQRDNYWQKWWPDTASGKLQLNKTEFDVKEKLYNQFKIDIRNGSDSIQSVLNIIPLGMDSTQLEWITVQRTSFNPVKRLNQFFRNKQRKNEIRSVLEAMQNYMREEKNVYGVSAHREVVSDTLMVSMRKDFSYYPSVFEVDSMIEALRKYAHSHGAKEVDSPMLHVDSLGPQIFSAQVAIPTDKALPNSGRIEFRRMVQGYMLIADVKGGHKTVKNAIAEIENLMRDHMRVSPAIPFELMITNRAKESDTTKWITRIYYPVVL